MEVLIMAIHSYIYGDAGVQYVGCVIDTFERNGHEDSDFYAVCWDEEQGRVVTIEYDTTRCPAGGTAEIDATEEAIRKAYRYYKADAKELFDKIANEQLAKKFSKGDEVVVVKGRKVAKGTIGKVFWIGDCYNRFTYQNESRVGILVGEEKVFLPLEYVIKNNWEACLLTGKARKQAIRHAAINAMPCHYRKLFN
jgi:hypothetical protein